MHRLRTPHAPRHLDAPPGVRVRALCLLAAVLTLVSGARQAAGQRRDIPRRAELACRGQTISAIEIDTRPPYSGDNSKWWQAPARFANSLHATTQEAVVRRFLLLQVGQPCDEDQRAETERILRAQPFIADARVLAVDDGSGGVTLQVRTLDELSPIIGASARGNRPYLTGVKVGNGNVFGSGVYASVEWRDNELRDTYAARLVDYQFMGRPYVLALEGARREVGFSSWLTEFSHPFLTDRQRIAWRATAGESREVFQFLRPDGAPIPLRMMRNFGDVGGVVRIGQPGRLSLFGMSFSREVDGPSLLPGPDPAIDHVASLFGRRKNARVNALWGVRNVHFLRVERFDALAATQDVREGFQLGMLLGRSLGVLGTTDDDVLAAADLYAGVGGQHAFVTLYARGEGRQNFDEGTWDGILASAQLNAYFRPMNNHTVLASVDVGGGWRQRVPFQLGLGDDLGGVRGYGDSRAVGAQRAVLRLEDRWYLGTLLGQASGGISLFTDVGRLWAGRCPAAPIELEAGLPDCDTPFGVDTRYVFGAGIGLLAAVPPASKRTWRLDVAFPLSPDPHARWELRLSSSTVRGHGAWREPRDLAWSRERAVPSSIFNWP